jgi:cell division protein FtsQ
MSIDQTLTRSRGARRRPLRNARRGSARSVRMRRPRLRHLLAVALLAGLLAGGWLWLRDASLTQVRAVTVTGTTSSAEPRIREALEGAARGMTTLHVRKDVLRKAVAGFPSVAGIRTRTDFPHGLAIEVLERRPAAVLANGDQLLAVTGSGLLLRDVSAPDTVPEIAISTPVPGERVQDPKLLGALAMAAAAPPALAKRTISIGWGTRGLNAQLESGPPLVFGSSADAAAKWAGAARVLADPSSEGALYLDLRVPGRVAAGGIGPVPEPTPAPVAEDPAPAVPTTPTPEAQP